MAAAGAEDVKVVHGGRPDGDQVREEPGLSIRFVLEVAVGDLQRRAAGAPRRPRRVTTWEGGFELLPAASEGSHAARGRTAAQADGRRHVWVERSQVRPGDRVVAEGVADLLADWALQHNAG